MIEVLRGDCRDALELFVSNSIDAVVTDPPYEITFMGKRWDGSGVAFDPDTWRAVLRVLKPGGHMLVFGGTRTAHRMVCVIEDAGFEVRDTLCWLYGQGFPKSLDISKAIDKAAGVEREVLAVGTPVKRMIPGADQNKDGWIKDNGREFVPTETAPATDAARQWSGWGTALKPGYEPIVLARKPLSERTVAANVLAHGTGGLNIDACRVDVATTDIRSGGFGLGKPPWVSGDVGGNTSYVGSETGRWPANVVHDGSEEVLAVFPDAPGQQRPTGPEFERHANVYGRFAGVTPHEPRGDSGSAARFFYCAKATKADRADSNHPTVKPVALLRWLARMITPPGGTVLDPFAGSGTLADACAAEGFDAVLIEQDANYIADINRRVLRIEENAW